MPEDPTTPTPDADRWRPSRDDKHMSKSAVRRMTGWSNDQIERILGEPDEIVIESDRHIKLYSQGPCERRLPGTPPQMNSASAAHTLAAGTAQT